MHIPLFAHGALRNQSIKGSTEVGAEMLYHMWETSLSILKKKKVDKHFCLALYMKKLSVTRLNDTPLSVT